MLHATQLFQGEEFFYKTRFFAKINNTVYSIAISDVSHFIFEDQMTVMVTNASRTFILNYSLEALEEMLNPVNFFRINRHCIIHINSIKKMNLLSKSRIETVLQTGLKEMVSRSRNAEFRKWLDL